MSESDKPAEASFLSRWSRRKVEAKNESTVASDAVLPESSIDEPPGVKMPEEPHPEPTLPSVPEARQELPSIDSLTHEADFSPFMAKDVDPGLRNLAMKKLFSDPHYQFARMDKLDIYLDDYSQPDPIPPEMLRQLNQAKSLFLFDDEDKDAPPPLQVPGNGGGSAAEETAGAVDPMMESTPSLGIGVAPCGASDEVKRSVTAAGDNDHKEDVELAGKKPGGKAT